MQKNNEQSQDQPTSRRKTKRRVFFTILFLFIVAIIGAGLYLFFSAKSNGLLADSPEQYATETNDNASNEVGFWKQSFSNVKETILAPFSEESAESANVPENPSSSSEPSNFNTELGIPIPDTNSNPEFPAIPLPEETNEEGNSGGEGLPTPQETNPTPVLPDLELVEPSETETPSFDLGEELPTQEEINPTPSFPSLELIDQSDPDEPFPTQEEVDATPDIPLFDLELMPPIIGGLEIGL